MIDARTFGGWVRWGIGGTLAATLAAACGGGSPDRTFLGTTAGPNDASGVVGIVVHTDTNQVEANVVTSATSTPGTSITCTGAVNSTGGTCPDPATPVICGDYCVPAGYGFICPGASYASAEAAAAVCGSSCQTCDGQDTTVTTAGGTTGGGTVTLTGSLSADGSTVSLTGSGASLSGTIDGDDLSGSYQDASGTNVFSAIDSTNGAVTRYCGSFSGADSGTWNLQASSSNVSGAFAGSAASGALNGSLSGSSISLHFSSSGASGTANGNLGAGSVTGTWSTSDGAGSGSWSGSTQACAGGTAAPSGCKCYPLICAGSKCAATL